MNLEFQNLERRSRLEISLEMGPDAEPFEPETESESNCRIIRFDPVELNQIEF